MELLTDVFAICGWGWLGAGVGLKLYGEKSTLYCFIPILFTVSFGLIAASLVLG